MSKMVENVLFEEMDEKLQQVTRKSIKRNKQKKNSSKLKKGIRKIKDYFSYESLFSFDKNVYDEKKKIVDDSYEKRTKNNNLTVDEMIRRKQYLQVMNDAQAMIIVPIILSLVASFILIGIETLLKKTDTGTVLFQFKNFILEFLLHIGEIIACGHQGILIFLQVIVWILFFVLCVIFVFLLLMFSVKAAINLIPGFLLGGHLEDLYIKQYEVELLRKLIDDSAKNKSEDNQDIKKILEEMKEIKKCVSDIKKGK